LKRRTVALITYGCAKNLVDSEVMAGHLLQAGYAMTGDPAKADILLLNTCGFIQPAKDEAVQGIAEALAVKKKNPRARVVVAGCYAERAREELTARFPNVDLWTGVKDFDKIVPLLSGKDVRPSTDTFLYSHRSPRAVSTPAGWAYLKVSEGCSHGCAFCAIPSIKGRYRSRPVSSIVQEARTLAARGVREINLISQDTTFFGRDKGRPDGLARLLGALIDVKGISWIRVLYGYPEEITDGLLEVMRDPKICPYFDIPFQHADRSILRAMKRSLDAGRALKLLDKIRKTVPETAIRTSLIVGFPGEGRGAFKALAAFVREALFDHLGVFTYSSEDGTSAAALGDPVPGNIKEARRNEILEIQAGISASKLQSYIGKTLDVLIEGRSDTSRRTWRGRTQFQAPEVDGAVVVEASWDRLENLIRRVKITSSDVYDLRGIPG